MSSMSSAEPEVSGTTTRVVSDTQPSLTPAPLQVSSEGQSRSLVGRVPLGPTVLIQPKFRLRRPPGCWLLERLWKSWVGSCIAILGVALTGIGLIWAIYSGIVGLQLQAWSARNDALQSCIALQSEHHYSAYCNKTIIAGVARPPREKRWTRKIDRLSVQGVSLVDHIIAYETTTERELDTALTWTGPFSDAYFSLMRWNWQHTIDLEFARLDQNDPIGTKLRCLSETELYLLCRAICEQSEIAIISTSPLSCVRIMLPTGRHCSNDTATKWFSTTGVQYCGLVSCAMIELAERLLMARKKRSLQCDNPNPTADDFSLLLRPLLGYAVKNLQMLHQWCDEGYGPSFEHSSHDDGHHHAANIKPLLAILQSAQVQINEPNVYLPTGDLGCSDILSLLAKSGISLPVADEDVRRSMYGKRDLAPLMMYILRFVQETSIKLLEREARHLHPP